MDFSKYPLEKLLYYVAAVIPGLAALLIYELASPGSFTWFFSFEFLGYKTKLGLILVVAFLIGYSMTAFLAASLGALGGVVGALTASRFYKPPHSYTTAAWRDPRWRAVLREYLGAKAPNDTRLLSDGELTLRQSLIDLRPEQERPMAYLRLNQEKLNAEIEDGNWASWYDHFHVLVLSERNRDFHSSVWQGFASNLGATAIYVLICATFVPGVRHWWCILPACLWVFLLAAEVYGAIQRYTSKWSTLSEQIRYLSEGGHSAR